MIHAFFFRLPYYIRLHVKVNNADHHSYAQRAPRPQFMATLQFSEGVETPPRVLYRTKQLLNNIVDGMASTRPCAVYAEVPYLSDSYRDGYRKVTYGALTNAINGVAWLLKDKIGESGDHQTLSYIGPNDLAYVIMVLGACKAGFKVNETLPTSTVC